MEFDDPRAKAYLEELLAATGGDTTATVSMYDVGQTIGLDRHEAGDLAQELIIMGLAELQSLAGGIVITESGLQALGRPGSGSETNATASLGKEAVLIGDSLALVTSLLGEIRAFLGKGGFSATQLDEMVIDCKTIEVQLLSPRPKTAVIRQLLLSLANTLAGNSAATQLATRLRTLSASE